MDGEPQSCPDKLAAFGQQGALYQAVSLTLHYTLLLQLRTHPRKGEVLYSMCKQGISQKPQS